MADGQQIDYDALSRDETFLKMPLEQQRSYLSAVDKSFAGLDPESQKGYISHLTGLNVQSMEATPTAKAISALPAGQLRLRNDVGLPPEAPQAAVANEYGRASSALASSAAATMATGGLNQGPGILRLLARSGTAGAASGGGALVGGATPSEAAGYAAGGAVAQPVAEGLSAGVRLAAAPRTATTVTPTPSVWENLWNRLTGKAGYAAEKAAYPGELEAAKNANLARYRLSEQTAQTAVDEAQANVATARAALPAGEAGQWADLNTAVGATPKSIRIGKGVGDLSSTYGNAGRGLLREGFDSQTLSKMTPPDQAQLIGPKWQAAGKAVQDTADKASASSQWVPVERYSAPGNEQGYFYAPKGEAMPEFGNVKSAAQIDESNLFKGQSSLDFLEKNGKLDEPIPSRLTDAVKDDVAYAREHFGSDKYVQGLKDPKTIRDLLDWEGFGFSTEFSARQQVAADILKKQGFKGAVWADEDELNPKQYQIWDRSVVHGANEKPGGVTFDAGKSVTQVIKNRIADPGLQEKAIDLINQHQRDLGIDNIREATPTQALALRQALRNDANFGPNSTTDSMKGIGRALYSAVSNDLHDAVPAMKQVDQHYGDLAEAVSAVQRQVQRYAAGQWKPPLTQVEKAQAKVPALPVSSPYTPLPAPPTPPGVLSQFLSAGKNLLPWTVGTGGALYGLERLRRLAAAQ